MKVFVKYKVEILLLFIVAGLYFLIRLPNLTLQPIFADEAIYIRWAQIMRSEPTLRFVSLQDGKTPLYMWLMVPMFKIFSDPLYAGRFLSVIAGFMSLVGVFMLSLRVFGIRSALWSVLIYTIVPYTVFFDRMALVDSMLAAFTIWSLYFAVWLLQSPRLDISMILGYFLGGALLVKTPAMMSLLALPFTAVGFNFKRYNRSKLLKLLLFWGVAMIIALVIYNALRLAPDFYQLSSRNGDYIFSPLELVGRPLDPFIPHFFDIKEWFIKLLTIPVLVLLLVGVIAVGIKKNMLAFAVLVWTSVPLLLEMAFLKTFTARYILFCIPPLLVISGFGLNFILEKTKKSYLFMAGVALMILLPIPAYTDYLLVTNPQLADLPRNERKGYFEDWTAGYGFSEIAEYLKQQNEKTPIIVGTEGFFGTLPDGLYIYLDKANIPIIGSSSIIKPEFRNEAKKRPTYFVGNKNRVQQGVGNAKLIMEIPKARSLDGRKQDSVVLYQLFPEDR